MRMKRAGRNIATLVTVLLLVLIAACAPTPEEIAPASAPTMERGIIEIRVTDPGVVGVTSANVTVENIEIHPVAGDWQTIIESATFDLVMLAETEEAETLGEATIDAGGFTGIRMDVTTVVGLTIEGEEYEATVPSEKFRIVKAFTVEDGVKTILTLDFDLSKSLVMTGEGKALFKPVLKLLIE